jgi:hypothetical protein
MVSFITVFVDSPFHPYKNHIKKSTPHIPTPPSATKEVNKEPTRGVAG